MGTGSSGLTWSPVRHDPTLIEPICQGSLIRYTNQQKPKQHFKTLLFSNPASDNKRVNITIRVSFDDGETWNTGKTLYSGPSAYSGLAVLPDGNIGCLYECGENNPYEKIVFVRLTFDWLKNRQLEKERNNNEEQP